MGGLNPALDLDFRNRETFGTLLIMYRKKGWCIWSVGITNIDR